MDYAAAALVMVTSVLSYHYYGADEFIMGAETFQRNTRTDSVMYYAFDMKDDQADTAMESFFQNYTKNIHSQFDYESKTTYAAEFQGLRNMFLLLDDALSFIVELVEI